MMKRRDFLKLSALAAPGALSYTDVFAQADAIQFGCPVPMSGPFAANGKYADMGMKLVLQKYGKVLGKNLSYTTLDTEGKPATAVPKPWACRPVMSWTTTTATAISPPWAT